MTLIFIPSKDSNGTDCWVSEFSLSQAANIQIERPKEGRISIFPRATDADNYAAPIEIKNPIRPAMDNFNLVSDAYPIDIKIVSYIEVIKAFKN